MSLKLLAIDPALSNVGFALLTVSDSGSLWCEDIDLVQTENEKGKTVRQNSDDLRRAVMSYERIKKHAEWADLIAAEIPVGTQSARGAMSNGISLGLMAAISTYKPVIQVTPTEAKRVATGRKTASKDEMIQWAMGLYATLPWRRLNNKPTGRLLDCNEHMADAIAIGYAAVVTPEFRAAMAMTRRAA
jgi:Holliday junction resolvasome RuvABC endonuclease subunit